MTNFVKAVEESLGSKKDELKQYRAGFQKGYKDGYKSAFEELFKTWEFAMKEPKKENDERPGKTD